MKRLRRRMFEEYWKQYVIDSYRTDLTEESVRELKRCAWSSWKAAWKMVG